MQVMKTTQTMIQILMVRRVERDLDQVHTREVNGQGREMVRNLDQGSGKDHIPGQDRSQNLEIEKNLGLNPGIEKGLDPEKGKGLGKERDQDPRKEENLDQNLIKGGNQGRDQRPRRDPNLGKETNLDHPTDQGEDQDLVQLEDQGPGKDLDQEIKQINHLGTTDQDREKIRSLEEGDQDLKDQDPDLWKRRPLDRPKDLEVDRGMILKDNLIKRMKVLE